MISQTVLNKLEYHKILEYISRYTSTENGKSTIFSTAPFDDVNTIIKNGSFVSEAKEIIIERDLPPLTYIPDLNESLARSTVEGAVLSKKIILEILNLAENSRRLFQFLSSDEEHNVIKREIAQDLFVDKVFEKHLSSMFNENGDIKDGATTNLKAIRKEIRDKNDQLRRVVNKLLKQMSSSLLQEEYMTQRDGRIVLPVKADQKRKVKGFIHSESATGQTVYIEPEETLELNNDILSLSFAEKREIERILLELTKKIAEVSYQLRNSLHKISEIDAIFAKARYSIDIIGSFPSIDDSKPFRIMDGRHPILMKKLGRDKTIPLNLEMRENNVILITGPNAGGKTVVLKTTGLTTLLVMSGIHVPVNPDSNYHFCTNVLIDVGDYQSLEDDLSTFSSHLQNIKNIIDTADDKTIILLDEIGTGTDPAEGSAIATAILIKLRDKKAKVLATTHHGNLKLTANALDGFENASMEFDTENLAPTYIFNQGLPGSSYAFEVAERIGFDKDFTNLAKEYLDTDKSRIEELLVDLEAKARETQRKLNKAEIENTRLSGLTKLYEEKNRKLEEEKKKILSKTKEEADSYLKNINSTVESAIKNIKESNAKKDIIREERKKIDELKKERDKIAEEIQGAKDFSNYIPKVGDYVKISNTSTDGTILEIDESKNRATISAGSIKLQVKLNNLIPAKENKKNGISIVYNSFSPSVSSLRLDIRGKRPEEAEYEIIRFIDDSYANNSEQIEILHGKGTGALKQTVQQILKRHEHVKTSYYAQVEFGGEGITIVELK